VGISKAAFYKHFPSKDDLMVGVLEDVDGLIRRDFRQMVRDRGGPSAAAQLRALLDVVHDAILLRDFHGCIFVAASMEFPLAHDPAHRAAARHKRAIEEFVFELAERAGVTDPQAMAQEMCLVMEGAYVTRSVTGDPATIAIARRIAEQIFTGTSRLTAPRPVRRLFCVAHRSFSILRRRLFTVLSVLSLLLCLATLALWVRSYHYLDSLKRYSTIDHRFVYLVVVRGGIQLARCDGLSENQLGEGFSSRPLHGISGIGDNWQILTGWEHSHFAPWSASDGQAAIFITSRRGYRRRRIGHSGSLCGFHSCSSPSCQRSTYARSSARAVASATASARLRLRPARHVGSLSGVRRRACDEVIVHAASGNYRPIGHPAPDTDRVHGR
jgi:AcrR family transcriptional regulator